MIRRIAAIAGLMTAVCVDVRACPECQVANAGMGKEKHNESCPTDPSTSQPSQSSWASRFHLAMGVEVPSSYIYHGYVQADEGLIVQPFMTFSYNLIEREDLEVRPYINWTNTLLDTSNGRIKHQHGAAESLKEKTITVDSPAHPGQPYPHTHTIQVEVLDGADGRPWFESQVTLGAVFERGDLFIDFKYHVCLYPDGSHEPVHELGARATYDLAGLWDKREPSSRSFSLRPMVLALWEIADQNGPENTYIEVGIEPQWRFKVAGQSIGFSVPIATTLSPDGYFTDSTGHDEAFGTWSTGMRVSWMLPINDHFGRWFLNASCTYYHFIADSTELSNGGDSDDLVTSVGIGVSF